MDLEAAIEAEREQRARRAGQVAALTTVVVLIAAMVGMARARSRHARPRRTLCDAWFAGVGAVVRYVGAITPVDKPKQQAGRQRRRPSHGQASSSSACAPVARTSRAPRSGADFGARRCAALHRTRRIRRWFPSGPLPCLADRSRCCNGGLGVVWTAHGRGSRQQSCRGGHHLACGVALRSWFVEDEQRALRKRFRSRLDGLENRLLELKAQGRRVDEATNQITRRRRKASATQNMACACSMMQRRTWIGPSPWSKTWWPSRWCGGVCEGPSRWHRRSAARGCF